MFRSRIVCKATPWINYDVYEKNKYDEMYLHPRSNVGFRKLVEDTSFAGDFVQVYNAYFGTNLPTSFVRTHIYQQMPLAVCLLENQERLVIDFRQEFSTDTLVYSIGRGSAIVLNTSLDFGTDEELTLAVVSENGFTKTNSFKADDRMQLHFVNKEKLVGRNDVFVRILDAICYPEHFFSLNANFSEPILNYLKKNLHISKCYSQLLREQHFELKKQEQQYKDLIAVGECQNFI